MERNNCAYLENKKFNRNEVQRFCVQNILLYDNR